MSEYVISTLLQVQLVSVVRARNEDNAYEKITYSEMRRRFRQLGDAPDATLQRMLDDARFNERFEVQEVGAKEWDYDR